MSSDQDKKVEQPEQEEKKETLDTENQQLNDQQNGNQKEQDEEFKVDRPQDDKKTEEGEDEQKEEKDAEFKDEQEVNADNQENEEKDELDLDQEIPESEKFDLNTLLINQQSLEKSLEYKEKGNKYFYEQLFDDAIEYYDLAAKYCPLSETKQMSIFCSNLAICYLRKNDYETVIEYSTQSIKLDPTFKKPYLNRITAYEKTEKLEEAIEDLKELEKLDPSDKQIKTKIFIMQKDLEKLNEKRKTEVLSGLKDLGNTLLGKFGLSLDNFKLNQSENGSYNIQFQK